MKQKLLFSLVLLSTVIFSAWSQKQEIRLQLKPNATEVNIAYRLQKVNDDMHIDLGSGETVTYTQDQDGLISTKLTIKNPIAESRIMVIDASKLQTLRLVNNKKSVEGVLSLESQTLQTFNCDFTTLSETPTIDFSKCPNIKEITLNEGDVVEVVLPENNKIETFQASNVFMSTKGLKMVKNLEKSTVLTNLGLKGCVMDTIDLRNAPKMTMLSIEGLSSSAFPKALLGAKAMKNLTFVNIKYCGFGYNELPDLNETNIDQFHIKKFYAHTINKKNINNLVVDLSYMNKALGMAEKEVVTTFTWQHKKPGSTTWENVDPAHFTNKDGLFTFKESLFFDGETEHSMRCLLFNEAYGNIGFYSKTGHYTYTIKVSKPSLTFKTDVPVGQNITIMAVGPKDGMPITFEGVDPVDGMMTFKVKSPEVKINGTVTSLMLPDNQITEIDLSKSLAITMLNLGYNKLSSLDLSKNVLLSKVLAPENPQLALVKLPASESLKELFLYNCSLQNGVDLSVVPNLETLSMSGNRLAKLNLSGLPKLKGLLVDNNLLTELDLSTNEALEYISVSNNQFENISVAGLKMLNKLFIYSNKIKGASMTTIMNELPRRKEADKAQIFVIDTKAAKADENLCSENDVKIAAGKVWMVMDYQNGINEGKGVEYKGFETSVEGVEGTVVSLYPNPTSDVLHVQGATLAPVMLVTMDGVIVKRAMLDAMGNVVLSVADLAKGQYVAVVDGKAYKVIVK